MYNIPVYIFKNIKDFGIEPYITYISISLVVITFLFYLITFITDYSDTYIYINNL